MLLAIDIGNTSIKMALFRGRKLVRSWRVATNKQAGLKQYSGLLKRLFAQQKVKVSDIEEIIICSVVPKISAVFKKTLPALFKKRPLVLGEDSIAPIKNLYSRPDQVGQDRLASAVAAYAKYGGPVVVVDFGTALTFDLISARGSYLGGVIVPGMQLALKALTESADLLPEVSLSRPGSLLGRDTATSIKSGIIYGYSFLVEMMLRKLQKKLGGQSKVVATGGEAKLMLNFCRSVKRVEENLTLEGLALILHKGPQVKIIKK